MAPIAAQDIIILKNGEELEAKVSEILRTSIKYKRFDNLSGPIYTLQKSEVFMIKFENGTKEVFNTSASGGHAEFYFYRPKKFASSKAKIIVGTADPDEVVVNLKNGSWYKMDYPHIGERDFVTGVYVINPELFTIDVVADSTYYLKCTVLPRGLKIMAELELVDKETAKSEMAGLKEQVKSYVD
ncbi:MAG: hypothetical protein AAF693_04075 [Bacteroidota bacterium]